MTSTEEAAKAKEAAKVAKDAESAAKDHKALEEKMVDDLTADDGEDFGYFRSKLLGLSTLDQTDPANPVNVRFEPRQFLSEDGETTYKRGFLRTNNQRAIKVFSNDSNVDVISKEQYVKAMKDGTPTSY